jgi:hypothetical protein
MERPENMSVLAKVLESNIKKTIEKGGDIEALVEKIDVFYASNKLTKEEYEYLTSLITPVNK